MDWSRAACTPREHVYRGSTRSIKTRSPAVDARDRFPPRGKREFDTRYGFVIRLHFVNNNPRPLPFFDLLINRVIRLGWIADWTANECIFDRICATCFIDRVISSKKRVHVELIRVDQVSRIHVIPSAFSCSFNTKDRFAFRAMTLAVRITAALIPFFSLDPFDGWNWRERRKPPIISSAKEQERAMSRQISTSRSFYRDARQNARRRVHFRYVSLAGPRNG